MRTADLHQQLLGMIPAEHTHIQYEGKYLVRVSMQSHQARTCRESTRSLIKENAGRLDGFVVPCTASEQSRKVWMAQKDAPMLLRTRSQQHRKPAAAVSLRPTTACLRTHTNSRDKTLIPSRLDT